VKQWELGEKAKKLGKGISESTSSSFQKVKESETMASTKTGFAKFG
jgi:hypothetical protein